MCDYAHTQMHFSAIKQKSPPKNHVQCIDSTMWCHEPLDSTLALAPIVKTEYKQDSHSKPNHKYHVQAIAAVDND